MKASVIQHLDDLPLPAAYYERRQNLSRTTLWRWEQLGLRILHVGGKRFIRPSDFAAFLETVHSRQQKEAM